MTNGDEQRGNACQCTEGKRWTISGTQDHRIGDKNMDLETMTALDLAKKIKQRQISVPG